MYKTWFITDFNISYYIFWYNILFLHIKKTKTINYLGQKTKTKKFTEEENTIDSWKYYIEYKGAAEGLQSSASNESRGLRSTASNPKGFSYEVKSLYAYKIPSEPVFTDDPLQPPATLSCCNYPNPFNPETTISFEIPKTDNVSLQIYNLKGQLIRTLVNDYLPAGKQSIVWNGTDNNNQPVASGVYLYKIKTGKYNKSAKMLLLK